MANIDPHTPEGIRLYNATEPVRVERDGLRGLAMPGFETLDAAAWPWEPASARKPQPLPDGYTRAKWSRSRLVLASHHNGHPIHLKRHEPYRLKSRLSAMLRGAKLKREWEIGRMFLQLGVMVPQPVFYAEARGGVTYLATRSFPASWISVESIVAENGADEALLLELAKATRWLHELGAYHDDYRSDHVYRISDSVSVPVNERFSWIDLDGATTGRQPSRAKRREAFFELYLSLHQVDFPRKLAVAMGHAYDPEGDFRLDHGRIWEETAHEFQDVRVRRRALKAKQAAKRQGSG